MSTALVSAPNSDSTTRYISAWAEETVEKLKSKSIDFIVLKDSRATRSVLESMLKKHSPDLVYLNGHGGPDVVCGQDDQVLIQAAENEGTLKGTITYALSCSSAKVLGPEAVKSGARAYIGYDEDFVFFHSRDKLGRPKEDRTAALFLNPANHVVVSLTKGHTVEKTCDATRRKFLENIQKLVSSETSVEQREYIRFLIWDMRSLVYDGDGEAVVSKN
jgi:hypothetical protein